MEENKKDDRRQNILLLLGITIFILIVGGLTYAFFNYTKLGSNNIVKVGNIEFSSDYNSISIQNFYPIPADKVSTATSNIAEVVVTINGKTSYAGGIEYLVSLTEIQNEANIPVNLLVTANNLGSSDNSYFTNRGSTSRIYQILAGNSLVDSEKIIVGYIPQNVDTNGTVSIKVYLDDSNVVISDTYDGTESETMGTTNSFVSNKTVVSTDDWNNLAQTPIIFKIKIEARESIWVTEEDNTLSRVLAAKIANGVNYIKSYESVKSENVGFKTQDTFNGTDATKDTVYYFNGSNAYSNSNIIFGDYCWNILRTTDNGGIKIIYNGKAENGKCLTNRNPGKGLISTGTVSKQSDWKTDIKYSDTFTYDLETGMFTLVNSFVMTYGTGDSNNNGIPDFTDLVGMFSCKSLEDTCSTLYNVGLTVDDINLNAISFTIGDMNHYSQAAIIPFNSSSNYFVSGSYMYNTILYPRNRDTALTGIYANSVTWDSTNHKYILNDPTDEALTEPDDTHHYACVDSSCTTVRVYYYFKNDTASYYSVDISNGVENILEDSYNYSNNSNKVINVHSSIAKGVLDNWYYNNLLSLDTYIDKDAVYCNDRNVTNPGSLDNNTSILTATVKFKNNTQNKNLYCTNYTDRFSASEDNTIAHLRYPVGLITPSEFLLVGNSSYFNVNEDAANRQFTMSSSYYQGNYLQTLIIHPAGGWLSTTGANSASAVRPVITLKGNVKVTGDGTVESPYKVIS